MSVPLPRVSVLLAVYNGERYLRAAVDSVLGQTFADFELIAIDDGSSDATPAILRGYAAADARVRVVSRPNRGLTNTLNEGLDLARAPYLARMDADDLCLPERFAKQVAWLDEHPDCVLVGSRVLAVDPDGLPIREMAMETTHEQIDHAHLNRGWPVVHPAVMMRLDAVRRAGGYRDQYNTLEDTDLFLRLAEVGRLANLPDVLLHYRQHFGSVTHTKAARQHELRQALYDEAHARRGQALDARLPPPPPPLPRASQHHDWAWAALKNGHARTARKHAVETVKRDPFSSRSWRVLACALRGH
jgi:glycosyltransferase involved in cell wall biosynthesis